MGRRDGRRDGERDGGIGEGNRMFIIMVLDLSPESSSRYKNHVYPCPIVFPCPTVGTCILYAHR